MMRPSLMFLNSLLCTFQSNKYGLLSLLCCCWFCLCVVCFVLFWFCCWHQQMSLCCGSWQPFPSVGGTCLRTKPQFVSPFPLLVSYWQDKKGAVTLRCYLHSAVSKPQNLSLIRQLSLYRSISYLEPRE